MKNVMLLAGAGQIGMAIARRMGTGMKIVIGDKKLEHAQNIETILEVDLYGTAVLLEEVGKVIAPGGSGVTISSQSGHRMPALPPRYSDPICPTAMMNCRTSRGGSLA